MNDETTSQKQLNAPRLTERQKAVLETLQSKETEKHPISRWYLGALYALETHNNPDRISQAAHSLRELVEKLPRVVQEMDVQGQYDFKGKRQLLRERLSIDREHYKGEWKGKEVDGHLDKTLKELDDYLERNKQPTRKERVEIAISKLDPMAGQLDRRIRDAKRDNLHRLLQELQKFTHHNSNPDIEEFRAHLDTLERIIIDLLAPITAQDQNEIQSILKLSNRSESDEERMLSLIERRGANFAFFFERVDDVSWIPVLKKNGYFDHPPKIEVSEEGGIHFRFWRPVHYLERVAVADPSLVVDTILEFQDTDNPRILYVISEIALKVEPIEQSLRLKKLVFKYLQSPERSLIRADLITKLMNRWAGASPEATDAALQLMRATVPFNADSESQDKQAHRRENSKGRTTRLEPQPLFRYWEYQDILEKGVRLFAEREPYQVVRILIDATAKMIDLQFHEDQLETIGSKDGLMVWCNRVNEPSDYKASEVSLVNALTFTCEKVFEKAPESVAAVEQALRNQRWDIFKRIRHHLYALYPNEQTKPWIREMIIAHPDYGKWQHHFEFQRMIRLACEKFGVGLLTEAEKTRIFEAILSGPAEENRQDRLEDGFTEEAFEKRKRYFHRIQLRPFAPVLFGKYQDYFQELKAEEENPVTDDDYPPFKPEGVKIIEKSSPKMPEELKNMSDEKILVFLNEWENVGHAPKKWWVEITFEGLAEAFQATFQESIIPNDARLSFWLKNRDQIERPIYVRAMLSAIQEHVKLKQFDRLNEWFELCEWVLLHPDRPKEEGVNRSDESREHSDWRSSRRAVGEFVEMCVNQDVDVPISARGRLACLLGKLCTQYDGGLDDEESTLLYGGDPMTAAINNTRSRALECLVDFGYWVRRQLKNEQAATPEVFTILGKRFEPKSKHPLKLPESSLLGLHYACIFGLNKERAIQCKDNFFSKDNLRAWEEAFRNFLMYEPKYEPHHQPTFDVIRDEVEFALNNLKGLRTGSSGAFNLVDQIGERLFTYYLREVYPLTGDGSLLEEFYEKTKGDKERWSHLFDHVGRLLKNSGQQLPEDLKDRFTRFFDWRFEHNELPELANFTFWLEAECLDADWRLQSYSKILTKILDIYESEEIRTYTQLESLVGMLNDHTALVVECFAKLIDLAVRSGSNTYIHFIYEAKPILRAGLNSDDATVRENAERAHENLLKSGHSDLLDLED